MTERVVLKTDNGAEYVRYLTQTEIDRVLWFPKQPKENPYLAASDHKGAPGDSISFMRALRVWWDQ